MQMQIAEFMEGAVFYDWLLVKLFPLCLAKVQLTMYIITTIVPVFTGIIAGMIIYDGKIDFSDFLA